MFRDNIWGADLANMQSLVIISEIRIFCVPLICLLKFVWVIPIKDKKGTTIGNVFRKIISKGRKPNKIWFDQDSEFFNNSFQVFLENKSH